MTHAQLVFATALGLALKSAHWPRAPFILGFVVGDLLETSSYQTAVIWGWSAVARPMTMVLAIALVGWVAFLLLRRRTARAIEPEQPDKAGAILPITLFAIAAIAELHALPTDAMPVFIICGIGVALVALTFLRPSRASDPNAGDGGLRYGWLVGGFLVANPLIGLTASSALFLIFMLQALRIRMIVTLLATALFIVAQFILLAAVFDVGIERDILGRGLWWLLGR